MAENESTYWFLKNFNTNSKSEALNSKQIRNLKFQCSKQSFEFDILEFRDCLGFRY